MRRRPDTALGLAIFALLMAGLFGLLAWRDVLRWTRPEPEPQRPWRVEAVLSDAGARATLAPKGGRIEASGRLTIMKAEPSPAKLEPIVHGKAGWALSAQPFDRAPMAIKNGVKALFRIVPHPPDEMEAEKDLLWVGGVEYGGGRLTLVDGCFRMNGPGGPILVFPPGTRLGLRDGWLMVGPPGLPPAMSARVGETVWWEGFTFTNFPPRAVAEINRICGPGRVESVLPASESVEVARADSWYATNTASEQGISWEEAMRPVRACRAREASGRLKPGEHCRVPPVPIQPGPPPYPPPPPPPRPVLR